jgi:kynurenine aminotransferase
VAVGFEQAAAAGFWEESRRDMKAKVDRFTAVFDELGLPVRSSSSQVGALGG